MRWLVLLPLSILFAIAVLLMALSPPALEPPRRADRVITGVTVIHPGVERLVDHTIEMRDGRIAALRPRHPEDPAPLCPGCFAIPGLIDAHVHTPPRVVLGNPRLFALLHLAHGVTTVRDVGESEPAVAQLAAKLNRGEIVGPRMLRCGPVLDGDPPGWPVATLVTDAAAGTAAVERLADEGVDCIKVYNEIGREAFDAVAAAARRRGLPLVGHVPHAVRLDHVRDFEAQHMTGVPYLSRPRPPRGWDIRSEDVLALSPAQIDHALAIATRQVVSFTPTLANFSLRLVASDPTRFPRPGAARWLPALWREGWDLVAGHPETESEIRAAEDAALALRSIVGRAHARGIDILAGTDTLMPWVIPGDSLHREIAELARALGSAEAALAAATTVNGRHLGPGEIGVLTPGARADLLLLPGDPTRDLAVLSRWRMLVADGRLYQRSTMDGWLEAYRQHFRGPLYSAVMDRIIALVADRFSHGSPTEAP